MVKPKGSTVLFIYFYLLSYLIKEVKAIRREKKRKRKQLKKNKFIYLKNKKMPCLTLAYLFPLFISWPIPAVHWCHWFHFFVVAEILSALFVSGMPALHIHEATGRLISSCLVKRARW